MESRGPDVEAAPGGQHSEALAAAVARVTGPELAYFSLERLLEELLERVREILRADTAAILLLDRDRDVLLARAARGIEEEVRSGVQIPIGRGFAGRIAAEQRPIAIEDVDHADILNPLLRLRGIRSLLGVPLLVEGRVVGVMHVGTLYARVFDDDDVHVLQMVADRAALAVENAHLAEQAAMTEALQRRLLPEALPEVANLRLSAKYLPAPGPKVGGDWFDVFTLPDGRVAFTVGDVVGRGVLAASVMAEIRTALRAYAIEGHPLDKTLMLLNNLLVSTGRNRGATVAMLALDAETERLSAVSAGHLPVLLRSPDGRTEFIAHSSGLPLGVHASEHYTEEHRRFPAGSTLLLYTDGLVERRGEIIDTGLTRLKNALHAITHSDHLPVADAIFARLDQGDEATDDVALLAVESLPPGDAPK
jgi:serine phosphatase RsbU (regulator of sigma subunit)